MANLLEETQILFDEQKRELEIYLSMLQIRNKPRKGSQSKQRIETNMLRASFILMLYSTVEAVVQKMIAEYCTNRLSDLFYENLSPTLQERYIKAKFSELDLHSANHNAYLKKSKEIVEQLTTQQAISFSSRRLMKEHSPSGNIDNEYINTLLTQHWCIAYDNSLIPSTFSTIKRKRNELAHGERTFNEIGADHTIAGDDDSSLSKYYTDITNGLSYIIETVNNHPPY